MNRDVPAKIYDLLKTLVSGNIQDYTITVHDPDKKGGAFLSDMCYVSLTNKNSGEATHIVVKQAFSDEKLRAVHPIRKYYLNEIAFYTKVWPCLHKFQTDKSSSEPFDKIPKCFVTSSENVNEKIVLENLKYQNFQTYQKQRSVEQEHMKFIFKQYGKFHAISLAYKFFKPQEFREITKGLENLYINFATLKPIVSYMKYIGEICLNTLDLRRDIKTIEKFKPYVEHAMDMLRGKLNYSGNYSVVLHGDCWSNNMMFKYNELQQVCDLKLLDFQFSSLGPPVADLSYCIYSGASKEMLDHLDDYLKVYHNSLSKTLEEFGLNSGDTYPFDQLKQDWKNYCQIGFILALPLWRVRLTDEDSGKDFTDLDDDDETLKGLKITRYDVDTFNLRIRDLIVHMAENEFL